MTNEDMCSALYRSLNITDVTEHRNNISDNDDSSSISSANSVNDGGGALYRIIRRFEQGDVNNRSSFDDSHHVEENIDEYGERESEEETVPIQPGTVNALRAQLFLVHDKNSSRHSSISVNSLLSRTSTLSNASVFSSQADDAKSIKSLSGSNSPEKHLSPSALRRSRFKALGANGRVHINSSALKETDNTHWSYGVSQNELLAVLSRRKNFIIHTNNNCDDSDNENQNETLTEEENEENSDSDKVEEKSERTKSDDAANNGPFVEADLNDQSSDTLTYDPNNDSDHYDNSIATSECSAERSNCDNFSIVSVSSFDIAPDQNKCDDTLTVSSDEFGSEACDTPGDEFLSVSALNEWCIAKSAEQDIVPVESKKAKYQRRLTERVNELLHTEAVYVNKLRHVVSDYIPEMCRSDVPSSIRGLKFDIFANIERIYEFHKDHLLPALRDCQHDLKKLGKCFRHFEKRFQLYVMYSKHNKRSNRLVYENRNFFKEKQNELGDRLDLSSYLLEPIQRLPRYRLFLEDLVKTYTNYQTELESESHISMLSEASGEASEASESPSEEQEAADADEDNNNCTTIADDEVSTLESLQRAKGMMETLLRRVDDMIALENIKNCPLDLMEQGRLLRQEEFVVIDANRRRHLMRVFLFESLIVLTAIYRKQPTVELFIYRDSIPVSELGLTPREKDVDRFSIFWRKRTLKPYTLVTSKPPIRDAWVKDIMTLLWHQAELNKEMLQKARASRNLDGQDRVSATSSTISSTDGDAAETKASDEKFSSLRGVPGEARAAPRGRPNPTNAKTDKKRRRTTWYCE